jgi:hypothetical protein
VFLIFSCAFCNGAGHSYNFVLRVIYVRAFLRYYSTC